VKIKSRACARFGVPPPSPAGSGLASIGGAPKMRATATAPGTMNRSSELLARFAKMKLEEDHARRRQGVMTALREILTGIRGGLISPTQAEDLQSTLPTLDNPPPQNVTPPPPAPRSSLRSSCSTSRATRLASGRYADVC
jgi:hypothetical protein